MTLQQLRYFVETVQVGSINKAAEILYLSQPSLSHALGELEHEIDCKLLVRSAKGVTPTNDGLEFLAYARQVLEQANILEQRWLHKQPVRRLCSISTQHYAFVVNAFVGMVKKSDAKEYEYTLREARTHEIIEDVTTLRSELGILYRNNYNRKVLDKIFKENRLVFHPLFTAKPHIFISATNPLAGRQSVTLEDLEEYPRLSFEQGIYNSFYFSEEILSTEYVKRQIFVGDRATIFNLMIGLNGYTISTGIVSADLNGDEIVSVPLLCEDAIEIGFITPPDTILTRQVIGFLGELESVLSEYGVNVQPLV